MNSRRWSRGEKRLMILSCGVCLPALALGWFYERQNELPPAPAVVEEVPPANNAFDVVMQAVAVAPRIPPASVVVKGKSQRTGFDSGSTFNSYGSSPNPYSARYNLAFPLQRKVAYLKAGQGSLRLWRSSLSLPLYVPGNASNARHFRNVSDGCRSLAFVQARACWQRGDNDGALRWLLGCHRDVCRQTRSFFNGRFHAVEIDLLWRFGSYRARAVDEMESLMPHLNAAQLRLAACENERDRALVPSRFEAAKRAKETNMARLYRACAANDVMLLQDPLREWPEEKTLPLRFRWANKKRGLEQVGKQWDWIIAQTQKPLTLGETLREFPDELRFSEGDPFLVAQASVDVLWRVPQTDAREIVLSTAMAARSFALEHHRNPRNLDELVPRYLKQVEADPFNAPHPLRYSPQPKTYRQFRFGAPIYKLPLPKDAASQRCRFPKMPLLLRPFHPVAVAPSKVSTHFRRKKPCRFCFTALVVMGVTKAA